VQARTPAVVLIAAVGDVPPGMNRKMNTAHGAFVNE
jgi:hypothetical protein